MSEIIERLDSIFKDVEDVTEPSNMDKVLMILEETSMADEEYMELLVDKLSNEAVAWEQPWYQVSSCLTRKPNATTENMETYEMGTFTKKECDRVEKNWRKFVEKFDVPDKPVCLARWRNRNKSRNTKSCREEFVRYFVTAYLARGVKRDLYQVNRHFLQTYGYPVKLRSYTKTEEMVMEICFYHSPQKAVTILSSVLGREPRGLYKRLCQYYNGKPEKKRVKWTLSLATKFLNSLLVHSGCSLEELKNNPFDQSVWLKVEQEMEHQYKHLQAFWYDKLHVQLFTECSVKRTQLRKIICRKLRKSPYKIWSDIRWKDLVLSFPNGFTHKFLHKVSKGMFQENPKYLTSPLSEVIDYAENVKKKRINRRLKCVKFNEEGNLTYVEHETDLIDVMFGTRE